MSVAGITGAVIVVAVGSPVIVVGAAKDVVAGKDEAAFVPPLLIRRVL